jgi:predicted nucleic acid-binding protein
VILADTSVWIDHVRFGEPELSRLLIAEQILVHPFVLGELVVGNLKNRATFIEQLRDMPQSVVAMDDEVLRLIEGRGLFGRGIGYVDAHLLASISLMPGTLIWTRDKRLHAIAEVMGHAFQQPSH